MSEFAVIKLELNYQVDKKICHNNLGWALQLVFAVTPEVAMLITNPASWIDCTTPHRAPSLLCTK